MSDWEAYSMACCGGCATFPSHWPAETWNCRRGKASVGTRSPACAWFSARDGGEILPAPETQCASHVGRYMAAKQGGAVYVLECGGMTKIGHSTDVEARIAAWRTSLPFKTLHVATIYAPRSLERELHKRFSGYAVRPEWFSLPVSAKRALGQAVASSNGIIHDEEWRRTWVTTNA